MKAVERKEALRETISLGTVRGFRLGLYDPDPDNRQVRFVGRLYKSNGRDAALIQRAIREFNRWAAGNPGFDLCAAAFPIESSTPILR